MPIYPVDGSSPNLSGSANSEVKQGLSPSQSVADLTAVSTSSHAKTRSDLFQPLTPYQKSMRGDKKDTTKTLAIPSKKLAAELEKRNTHRKIDQDALAKQSAIDLMPVKSKPVCAPDFFITKFSEKPSFAYWLPPEIKELPKKPSISEWLSPESRALSNESSDADLQRPEIKFSKGSSHAFWAPFENPVKPTGKNKNAETASRRVTSKPTESPLQRAASGATTPLVAKLTTALVPTWTALTAPVYHAHPAAHAHLLTNAYQHETKTAAPENEMPASLAQAFVPASDNVETGYVKLYPLRHASGLHDLPSILFRKSGVVPPKDSIKVVIERSVTAAAARSYPKISHWENVSRKTLAPETPQLLVKSPAVTSPAKPAMAAAAPQVQTQHWVVQKTDGSEKLKSEAGKVSRRIGVSARPQPYPLPRTSRQLDSGPSILFKQSDVMPPQRFAYPIEVSEEKLVRTTVNRSYPEIFHQENVSPETQVSKLNPNGPRPDLLKNLPVSLPRVKRVQSETTIAKPLTARITPTGNSRIENTDESFKSIKPRSVSRLIDFWENQ